MEGNIGEVLAALTAVREMYPAACVMVPNRGVFVLTGVPDPEEVEAAHPGGIRRDPGKVPCLRGGLFGWHDGKWWGRLHT